MPPLMTEVEESVDFTSDVTAELVQYHGSDALVVDAARVSTGTSRAGDDLSSKDAGLISFLLRESHMSPFEHSSFTFLIDAPIFVAREFMRHRTFSYSEASQRYREAEPRFYIPAPARPLVQIGKPGAYEFVPGSTEQWTMAVHAMQGTVRVAYGQYRRLLDQGIAREVARNVLPVGTYTQFYATANARNLLRFFALRTKDERSEVPSYPLHEIEAVARQMEDIFAEHMPVTYTAWNQYGRRQT